MDLHRSPRVGPAKLPSVPPASLVAAEAPAPRGAGSSLLSLNRRQALAMFDGFDAISAKAKDRRQHEKAFRRIAEPLDRSRARAGLRPLRPHEREQILADLEGHGSPGISRTDRYAALVDQVSNEKDGRRMSMGWVLSRIAKANDEPYIAGHHPIERVNLNDRVSAPDGDTYVCCDISALHLHDMLGSDGGKVDLRHFSKEKALEQHFNGDTRRALYRRVRASAKEAHIIQTKDFGTFLQSRFSEMKPGVRASLVETANHTMTTRLRKKMVDGAMRHVVTHFDPNGGNRHLRVEKSNAGDLPQYGLSDFIRPARLYSQYYREREESCLVYLYDRADRPVDSSRETRVDGIPCTLAVPLTPQTLAHILDANLVVDVTWARDAMRGLSSEAAVAILRAEVPRKPSGLYMALQNGSATAIELFGELLVFAPKDEVASLVSALDEGTQGFYMAMQGGHARAVRAYVDIVIDAYEGGCITAGQLEGLLAGRDGTGRSGLYVAACHGDNRVVDAYLQGVARMPRAQRAAMLSMSARGGVSALKVALRRDDVETANALFDILRQAQADGLITAGELAELSMDAGAVKLLRDGSLSQESSSAYRMHLDHVMHRLMTTRGSAHSMSRQAELADLLVATA